MSHSRSTSKGKDGNDDKNKSQEDDNITEISLHQKDSKCSVLVCSSSMSHSRSTSKDKDGNDNNNKSQEDDNISEIILHQKDSKCTVLVCC